MDAFGEVYLLERDVVSTLLEVTLYLVIWRMSFTLSGC